MCLRVYLEIVVDYGYIVQILNKASSQSNLANFIEPPHSTKIKLGTKKKSGSFLNLKKKLI